MIGNMAVYAALTEPGDTVMTIPQPVGGHSSNRHDGPAGIRGLNIVDVPFDAQRARGRPRRVRRRVAPRDAARSWSRSARR